MPSLNTRFGWLGPDAPWRIGGARASCSAVETCRELRIAVLIILELVVITESGGSSCSNSMSKMARRSFRLDNSPPTASHHVNRLILRNRPINLVRGFESFLVNVPDRIDKDTTPGRMPFTISMAYVLAALSFRGLEALVR